MGRHTTDATGRRAQFSVERMREAALRVARPAAATAAEHIGPATLLKRAFASAATAKRLLDELSLDP